MNLPEAFCQQTRAMLGNEQFELLTAALQSQRTASIRINEAKVEHLAASLTDGGCTPVPWAHAGRYLEQRPAYTFDPRFHAGLYYAQEASSMFLEQAVNQCINLLQPTAVLDLCAAPGGKSTHLRSLLPDNCLLVANEVMRNRVPVLAENLAKWGHPHCVVTRNDPADFSPLAHCFDAIVTDVPCSGEGMFRKDQAAIDEWSPANVDLCQQRQRRILTDIWPCLKPGGVLVYSTCTYNTKENEENVRWMCHEWGAEVLALDVPPQWGITGNLLPGASFPVYRFLPHKTQGEGFFLAVLRKTGDDTPILPTPPRRPQTKVKPGKAASLPKSMLQQAREWMNHPDDYVWMDDASGLTAYPRLTASLLKQLKQTLYICQAGVRLGEVKGRDLLPQQALAMSLDLRRDAFCQVDVPLEQALSYLRKEPLVLPSDTPRGLVLLTYQDMPLGFVKQVGNRANNLYPVEWRIRSTYTPGIADGTGNTELTL